MSLTTQSANLVRQKAYISVYGNATGTSSNTNSPFNYYAFKALFLHLAMNKGNPDLFYKNIDGTYSASDGGNNASQILVDAACTLYAVFLRKVGSVETIVKGTNHASTAATDGTQDLAFALTVAGSETIVYPDGRALSTGLTVTENTTRTGSTLTLKANRVDGFVIVGA
jgi:hypothetical protein